MSFLTGIRASTSRSSIALHPIRHVGLQYRHASDKSAITKATTVQEIDNELSKLEKKEKEMMRKAAGPDMGRATGVTGMRRVVIPNEMQQLRTIILEDLTEPKLTIPVIFAKLDWVVGLKPPYWRWRQTLKGLSERYDWLRQAIGRRVTTFQTLDKFQRDGLVALSNRGQIRELPLFDRFFGRILPSRWHLSYLPTTRHALDIYTAYNHAQATQDFNTINAVSLKTLRKTARSVAVSFKVKDWGYDETPDVPRIMWSRTIPLGDESSTSLNQICYQFDTKQYVVINQNDPKTGAPTTTRHRHVVENIIFQSVDPDPANQGWMMLERVPTTPPLYLLDGTAKAEQEKFLEKRAAAMRNLQGREDLTA